MEGDVHVYMFDLISTGLGTHVLQGYVALDKAIMQQ